VRLPTELDAVENDSVKLDEMVDGAWGQTGSLARWLAIHWDIWARWGGGARAPMPEFAIGDETIEALSLGAI
jgi:hypothetical protein